MSNAESGAKRWLSADDIIASFEMILGRTPSSSDIQYHLDLNFRDRFELGNYIISTGEFQSRFRKVYREISDGAGSSTVRPSTVYLGDYTALTRLYTGHLIYVDTRSVDVGSHLMMKGEWESGDVRLFDRLINPGDTVLDIGANHGVYALVGASATGLSGRVHAFEPNPRFARLVGQTLAVNGFGGISSVHVVGVSENDGEALLSFENDTSGGAYLARQGSTLPVRSDAVPCRIVALDDYLPDNTRVDVMKIDIEGHEGFALRGMRRLLERSANLRLIMEFAPEMMAGQGVGGLEVVNMLAGMGFRFWMIEHNGEITATSPDVVGSIQNGLRNLLISRLDLA